MGLENYYAPTIILPLQGKYPLSIIAIPCIHNSPMTPLYPVPALSVLGTILVAPWYTQHQATTKQTPRCYRDATK